MKVYKSDISWALVIFVAIIIIGVGIPLISNNFWFGLVFTLAFPAFLLQMFCTTYYIINDNLLTIKSSFLYNEKIEIDKIVKIEDTWSILSSPAFSFKNRIEIKYNKWDLIIVSPKDKEAFVNHLLSINPTIVVKTKTK
jgi:hypothetical protein